jgi:hypothetical protein
MPLTSQSHGSSSKEILIQDLFFVAKPFRTPLFHGRNSEPDRGGFLFLCQEQSTNKISLSALVALAPHLDKCNLRQDVI